jgi:hypothetical protein
VVPVPSILTVNIEIPDAADCGAETDRRAAGTRAASAPPAENEGEYMHYVKKLLAAAGAGCLAVALAGTAPAFADYGKGAQFQIEISANNVGGVPGDGVWLWIALNRDGTGDYQGTDCVHTGSAGLNGAAHESGDVQWTNAAGQLTITGVRLVGGLFPVTVVVKDRIGHYVGPSDSFVQGFALGPIGGTAQVQVAP